MYALGPEKCSSYYLLEKLETINDNGLLGIRNRLMDQILINCSECIYQIFTSPPGQVNICLWKCGQSSRFSNGVRFQASNSLRRRPRRTSMWSLSSNASSTSSVTRCRKVWMQIRQSAKRPSISRRQTARNKSATGEETVSVWWTEKGTALRSVPCCRDLLLPIYSVRCPCPVRVSGYKMKDYSDFCSSQLMVTLSLTSLFHLSWWTFHCITL